MNKPFGVVYEILFPNGKRYIGQTTGFKKRMNKYKHLDCEGQPYFYNALLKYGWDNVVASVLYECSCEAELNLLEKVTIAQYGTTNGSYGYNLLDGGSNGKHSEESKRKMSETRKGRKMTQEQRDAHRGWKHSEESKAKMRESHKGWKPSQEVTRKRANTLKERYASGLVKSRAGIPSMKVRDQTIYHFRHKDGREFKGTRREMEIYNEFKPKSLNDMFSKKMYTNYKGWHLVQDSSE